MEDRFMVFEMMKKVSEELKEAGFKHVISRHFIDKDWHETYRPDRPEISDVAWTVSITEYLLPIQKIKSLIDICEKNGLVVWWGSDGDDERVLYVKIGTSENVARRYNVENSVY